MRQNNQGEGGEAKRKKIERQSERHFNSRVAFPFSDNKQSNNSKKEKNDEKQKQDFFQGANEK